MDVIDLEPVLLNQEKLLAVAGDAVKVIIITVGLVVGLFCLNFFFRMVFSD